MNECTDVDELINGWVDRWVGGFWEREQTDESTGHIQTELFVFFFGVIRSSFITGDTVLCHYLVY